MKSNSQLNIILIDKIRGGKSIKKREKKWVNKVKNRLWTLISNRSNVEW